MCAVKTKSKYIPPADPKNPKFQGPPHIIPSLCFICHKNEPIWTTENGWARFGVCTSCKGVIEAEVKQENEIKSALYRADDKGIFRYTLGAELTPRTIPFELIPNWVI